VIGVVLVWAFFLTERVTSAPLIQLGLLRIRNVLVANLTSILSGLINFVLFYAIVYYAELPAPSGLGLDVQATGLIMLPAAAVMLVVGPVSGRVVPKIGAKPVLLAGSAALTVGFLTFMSNRATAGSLTVDAVIAMAGVVALFVPVVNMISMSLPQQDVAVGQGLNSTLKMIGQACGPVIATAIMTSFSDPITSTIGGRTVVVGSLPSATAFNLIFTIGIALTILVAIVSLMARNLNDSL
jgi:MFS family permease